MLKFLYRLCKHLSTLIFISLPLQLIGSILVLGYLPILRKKVVIKLDKVMKEEIKMPYLLRWFDCADMYVGRDYSTYLSKFKETFWTHYTWLCWRNPTNYFEYIYLGFKITSPVTTKLWTVYRKYENNYIADIGDSTGDQPGLFVIEIECQDKIYYEYYYIKQWTATKCLRFRLGYKIGQDPIHPTKLPQYVQQCLVLSPWHSYSGITSNVLSNDE